MDQHFRRAAAPIFALVMFFSAALIFLLQPMFARVTTPLLGGSPAVWNTSMVFFQAALLLGYGYAHALNRIKALHLQVAVHAVVLLLGCVVLPIAGAERLGAPDAEAPALWLFTMLALHVGAPYAAASATAPLVQAWYARTGRADAADPYYLYAASNLGSLLGLLAYPLLVEPALGLAAQRVAWSWAYVGVGALIVAAGVVAVLCKGGPAPAAPVLADGEAARPLTWRDRMYWLAAAAIPSSLLLGVTLHISTDVASAPFLWVVPLALYLLTFVIAFGKGSEKYSFTVTSLAPIALALLIASYSQNNWFVTLFANLTCFVLAALVCHLALAAKRPSASHLTEYFLLVSAGGVVGGAFTALIAPMVFDGVYEYPLALAATCLFFAPRPSRFGALAWFAVAVAVGLFCAVMGYKVLVSPSFVGGGSLLWSALGVGLITAPFAITAVGFAAPNRPRAWRIGIGFGVSLAIALLAALATARSLPFLMTAAWALPAPFTVLLAATLVSAALGAGAIWAAMTFARSGTERTLPVVLATGIGLPLLAYGVHLGLWQLAHAEDTLVFAALVAVAVGLLLSRANPRAAAGLVLTGFAAALAVQQAGSIYQDRSFFGVVRIEETQLAPGVAMRTMLHGTTIHGAQLRGANETQPLTYYAPGTSAWLEAGRAPWGKPGAFENPGTALGIVSFAALNQRHPAKFGLVGLGSGASACLAAPVDELVVFEIDPHVVDLSGPEGTHFSFVAQCQPQARMVVGDARLGLESEADGSYDLLVIDAFSSDAVPAHLLTLEAVSMYVRKLKPDGVLVLHLSNRNLDLDAEAARVALAAGLSGRLLSSRGASQWDGASGFTALGSSALVAARSEAVITALALERFEGALTIEALSAGDGQPWSDDYINLARALRVADLGGQVIEGVQGLFGGK